MNTFFLDCTGGKARAPFNVPQRCLRRDTRTSLPPNTPTVFDVCSVLRVLFCPSRAVLVFDFLSVSLALYIYHPLALCSVPFPLSSQPLRSKTRFQSVDPHLKSIAISAAQDIKYMPARSDTCVQARLFAFRRLFVPLPVQNNQ